MIGSSMERRRGRRRPEQTRAEILDAACAFLSERPFRELTVGRLMERTSVGRSSFYIHFSDLYALAAALLEQLDARLERATRAARRSPDFPDTIDEALAASVGEWERNGPILRAIAEASAQDGKLDDLYRRGFLHRSIERVCLALKEAQARNAIDPDLDARAVAALLILMHNSYLADALGRRPQTDADKAHVTLVMAWRRILGIDG